MGATGPQMKYHRSILIACEQDLMKEGGGGRGTIILIPRDPPALTGVQPTSSQGQERHPRIHLS